MNKNAEKLEKNTLERSFNDFIYNSTFPKKIENYVLRFNQSSVFINPRKINNNTIPNIIFPWLKSVEKTDVLPAYFDEVVKLTKNDLEHIKGSFRNYDIDKNLSLDELSYLFNNSFGRNRNKSKRYGSAGALYPVIPLLMVFKSFLNLECGVYVYNSEEQTLLKITNWTLEESKYIKKNVCFQTENLPNTCIAYAVDIRRAIIKYHIRGYRHALIEVGAMSQGFKEVLHSLNDGLGEVCWSGFNDNELTFKAGLNIRLCPIMMLQWFGYIKK